MKKSPEEKSKCSICQGEGDGFHFGAEACKACAAFFRRSISLKRTYVCKETNNCGLIDNARNMCQACRFSKCLKVGMNPMGVQTKTTPITLTPTTQTSLLTLTLPTSFNDSMPLLSKMRSNYQKLCNARIVIHKETGENLFKEKIPRAISYKELVEQGIKDKRLTADWITWCFEDFCSLAMDQKNALFRNFFTPFYVLECVFTSHVNNRPDRVIYPSGDFIDVNHLDLFYKNLDNVQPMDERQVDELFKPSFILHQKALVLPMMNEQLDIYEFFALTTILLWDTGLVDISDDCRLTGKRVKDQIMTELIFYMKNYKNIEEPGIRIASIVNFLPAVYKSARRIQDDVEVTRVFNIYTASEEFCDLINGNFC